MRLYKKNITILEIVHLLFIPLFTILITTYLFIAYQLPVFKKENELQSLKAKVKALEVELANKFFLIDSKFGHLDKLYMLEKSMAYKNISLKDRIVGSEGEITQIFGQVKITYISKYIKHIIKSINNAIAVSKGFDSFIVMSVSKKYETKHVLDTKAIKQFCLIRILELQSIKERRANIELLSYVIIYDYITDFLEKENLVIGHEFGSNTVFGKNIEIIKSADVVRYFVANKDYYFSKYKKLEDKNEAVLR